MHIAGSSNGRTIDSGSIYLGSSPSPAASSCAARVASVQRFYSEVKLTGLVCINHTRIYSENGIPAECSIQNKKSLIQIGDFL